MAHPSEPVSPADYGEGPADDAALEAAGWAAGLDVWGQVSKAYGNYLGDGTLANAQLWSLRQAIRAQAREEDPA
jgi:hypothetical protein